MAARSEGGEKKFLLSINQLSVIQTKIEPIQRCKASPLFTAEERRGQNRGEGEGQNLAVEIMTGSGVSDN